MKKIKKDYEIKDQLIITVNAGYACTGIVMIDAYDDGYNPDKLIDIDLETITKPVILKVDKTINKVGIMGKLIPLVGKSKVNLDITILDGDKIIESITIGDNRFMIVCDVKKA